jgi:energy-coupling factor transporter ATP-binding protein EcfA2
MRIRIKNFKIIEDLDIEVKGTTVVVGGNGHGKSSLVSAIRAVCFGHLGNQFIRHNTTGCEAWLEFEDQKFGWVRDENIKFYLGDSRYDKTKGVPPEEYANALKIKKIPISKTTDLRPNFLMQFDPLFLIRLGDVELANALSFLFSGQKFPNLLKLISSTIKDSKKDLLFIEGQLLQKEKSIHDLKQGLDAFQKLEKFFGIKDTLFNWYNDISNIDTVLHTYDTMEKDMTSCIDAVDKYRKFSKIYSTLNEEVVLNLESVNSDIELLEKEAMEVFSCEVSCKRLRQIDLSFASLRETVPDDIENIGLEIEVLEKELLEISGLQSIIATVSKMLVEKDLKIKELMNLLSNCPFCGVELGEVDKARLVEGS